MSGERDRTGPGGLVAEARDLARREPLALGILGISVGDGWSEADLLTAVLSSALPGGGAREAASLLVGEVFGHDRAAVAATLRDIAVTAAKNFEPGGEIATLLFSRGIHAVMSHRVAHSLWVAGRRDAALAVKTAFSRVFSTDIHPAATFGSGIWLDHGVGFVVGETAILEDDVSIWHGVTLGSTLKDSGEGRHPRLRRGCTIGADCVILGGVETGEGSVVAAGSVVLSDVAPRTTVAGVPARPKARSAGSFTGI